MKINELATTPGVRVILPKVVVSNRGNGVYWIDYKPELLLIGSRELTRQHRSLKLRGIDAGRQIALRTICGFYRAAAAFTKAALPLSLIAAEG